MFEFLHQTALDLVNQYGLIGLFLVSCIGTSIIPIPVEAAVLFIRVFGYDSVAVGLTAGLGSGFGSMINYYIGFFFGKKIDKISKRSGFLEKLRERFKKSGFFWVFFSALTPLPYDVFTIAAGFLHYNPLLFLIASILGRTIRFTLIAYFGEVALKIFLPTL